MNEITAAVIGAIVGSLVTGLVNFFAERAKLKLLRSEIESRKEAQQNAERRAEIAERELMEISRRRDGPWYRVTDRNVMRLYPSDLRIMECFGPRRENGGRFVLKPHHDRVVPEESTIDWIMLVVENDGVEPLGNPTLDMEGVEIYLEQDDQQFSKGQQLKWFRYRFDPNLLDREQTIAVRFIAKSGMKDVQRYVTRHGCRVLKRIDPS